MNKSGKVWGETSRIHANSSFEFHRIEARAKTRCSKHLHQFKWNGFYVESGHLIVCVWQKDYDLVDETHLKPGDFMQVKPGLYHNFEAVEDTVAFELYWAEFNHNDILRETIGRDLNSHPIASGTETGRFSGVAPNHEELSRRGLHDS